MGNDGQAGREKAPWERLEGEPAAAYARFLVYRNLGPTRTLQRAWEAHLQAGKRGRGGRNRTKSDDDPVTHRSSTWAANAVAFHWGERAGEWDIAMLSQVGAEAVVDFVNILRLYEVWLKTGSQRARALLGQLGVQPVSAAGLRREH